MKVLQQAIFSYPSGKMYISKARTNRNISVRTLALPRVRNLRNPKSFFSFHTDIRHKM